MPDGQLSENYLRVLLKGICVHLGIDLTLYDESAPLGLLVRDTLCQILDISNDEFSTLAYRERSAGSATTIEGEINSLEDEVFRFLIVLRNTVRN